MPQTQPLIQMHGVGDSVVTLQGDDGQSEYTENIYNIYAYVDILWRG